MAFIKLGSVRAFPNASQTKAQALKVLEEASEVVDAFKRADRCRELLGVDDCLNECARDPLDAECPLCEMLDESADCITAISNLAAAHGVTDLTPYIARCEERNRGRGRYDR